MQDNPDWERGTPASIAAFGRTFAQANEAQRTARRAIGYRGRGAYVGPTTWKGWGARALGGLAGGLGGWFTGTGWASGAKAGWDRGASYAIGKGWGDYTVNNSLISGGSAGSQTPIQVQSGMANTNGDIIVSHREFVQNVIASGTAPGNSLFQITSFPLNAGLETTFPFLSQLAQNYTLVEFGQLIFQYVPTSGEFGSTIGNALGKVIAVTNYDPDAPAFTTSQQCENYAGACVAKPACGLAHGVECAPGTSATNMLYVRTGVSSKAKVFTDLGNFMIATEGIPLGGSGATTVIVGELWVTYTVKLSRPQLFGAQLALNDGYDQITWTASAAAFVLTAPVNKSTNNIGVTVTNVSTTAALVSFPNTIVKNACYLCWCSVNVVAAGETVTFANPSNISNALWWLPAVAGSNVTTPQTGAVQNPAPNDLTAATTNKNFMSMTGITCTIEAGGLAGPSFRFNITGALPGAANVTLIIHEVPQGAAFQAT